MCLAIQALRFLPRDKVSSFLKRRQEENTRTLDTINTFIKTIVPNIDDNKSDEIIDNLARLYKKLWSEENKWLTETQKRLDKRK